MLCMLNPKIVKLLRLWWTYALDPAHCHVARDVRVTAMYWVEIVPLQCLSDTMVSHQIMLVLFWQEQEFRSIPVIRSNSGYWSPAKFTA